MQLRLPNPIHAHAFRQSSIQSNRFLNHSLDLQGDSRIIYNSSTHISLASFPAPDFDSGQICQIQPYTIDLPSKPRKREAQGCRRR